MNSAADLKKGYAANGEEEGQQEATVDQTRSLTRKTLDLIADNSAVGYPSRCPSNIPTMTHGWFYDANREVIESIVNGDTSCIVELGTWLGRSALYFVEKAPNAVIFTVDLWSNDFLLTDSHYTASGENLTILKGPPIYEQYIVNTWEQRYRRQSKAGSNSSNSSSSNYSGLVPMKMDTVAALELLKANGITPDVIYVDANHHYNPVIRDVEACLRIFPEAQLIGDDWDYEEVRRAVKYVANKHGKELYVNKAKCWTFSATHCTKYFEDKAAMEKERAKEERKVKQEKRKLADAAAGSFADMLSNYSKLRKT